MRDYINYSGGAPGSDLFWESMSLKYGIRTVAFSFPEHKTVSRSRKDLTIPELIEGYAKAEQAAKGLKRNIELSTSYVKKLLSRDWFQVKNSDEIFAVGRIIDPGKMGNKYMNKSSKQVIDGGTGYACMMGIQHNKNVNVFNQLDNKWYKWDFKLGVFVEQDTPILTKNFAGVGTRELSKDGENAIKNVFIKSFGYE